MDFGQRQTDPVAIAIAQTPLGPKGTGSINVSTRADWTVLTDAQLLAQCAVDTYRASGPGGQKRNKTSSAVRIRHKPSGLAAIAEESRSQHENRARALKRLRRALYLELRENGPLAEHSALLSVRGADGRLVPAPRSVQYLPAVAVLLDLLDEASAGMRDVATAVGTTTANLADFLAADDTVWRAVNALRARHGRSPLRA